MEFESIARNEVSDNDLAPNRIDNFEIDADKLIEPKSGEHLESPLEKSFNPDRLIYPASREASDDSALEPEVSKADGAGETKLYTTREERINPAPKGGGIWTGERGDSKFIHADENIRKALEKYGIDGIEYKDGVVDFSPISIHSVDIDMTSRRYGPGGNFEKADTRAAEDWNAEDREGRADWEPRDVAEWRKENGYTWHECSDQRTCELVPSDLHAAFHHTGGVCECKRREEANNRGDFDD